MTRPRWLIVSDGTPTGTSVRLDGVDVSHTVGRVTFDLRARDVARVTIELGGPDVDLDVTAAKADVVVTSADADVVEAVIYCGAQLNPGAGDGIECVLPDGHDPDVKPSRVFHDDGRGNRWSA